MAFGCTITVNAGKTPSAQSNFVWLATAANFPLAAKDGGTNSILNGGGNLRFYTDSTKATRLPIDVVSFVTGGSPVIQVWGLSPSLNVASTVYVEADEVETAQPAFSAAFGRNAVWVDYESVIHANETGTNGVFVDSTGNGHDTTLTTGASLATTSSGNPFGLTWPNFITSQALTLSSSSALINNSAFTLSIWFNADTLDVGNAVFGCRDTGDNWAQIQSDSRVFSKASTTENVVNNNSVLAGNTYSLKMKQNSTILTRVLNGADDGSDNSVTDGEGIVSTSNFLVGSYFDNASNRRYDGRVGEIRVKRAFDSADLDLAEYNNQSDPASFWSTSAWEDSSGGEILVIDSGAYTLSGTTTALTAQYKSTAESGTYSLSGSALGLIHDSRLIADNGTYSLTGSQSNLVAARKVISDSGSYSLTGADVTLVYTPGGGGEVLSIDTGTFGLSGSDIGLKATRLISANTGGYDLTGQSVALTYNAKTIIDSGSYALTGSNVNLFANRVIIAQNGSYNLIGSTVTLRYSGEITQTIGSVTAGFAGDKYSVSYKPNSITVNFKE